MQQEPLVLLVVPDLLAGSRMEEAARGAGATVRRARRLDPSEPPGAALVVIDLDRAGALDELEAWQSREGARVLGFVSHVDTQTRARAESLGAEVATRGSAAARLRAIAGELAAGT